MQVIARRRILVVDDDRDSATSLATLLNLLGNEAHAAFDGESALAAAESFRPHVALMDLGLPRMDGCEVGRRIKNISGCDHTTLIAITGWSDDKTIRRTTEHGFAHYFVKPVSVNVLCETLGHLSLVSSL